MAMKLRPYQEDAVEAVLNEWETEGNKKVLIVLATGCGKTIIFSNIVKCQVEKGHRVLILAHRGELLNQAADKLYKATGLTSVLEKAEFSCLGSEERVVVGSIQSLAREDRLNQFPSDYFQDIIIDETHHCMSETYQRVLSHFSEANVLGVTATPDRGDMKDLGDYFDTLAYEYGMIDAIKDGYLTPIKAQTIPLQLDISQVGLSNGDFAVGELGDALEPCLKAIANEMAHYCWDRKTIVFTPLVKTSQSFCKILQDIGFSAVEVHGTSKDREEVLQDFENGKYNVIVNSMLLTEGFDSPQVDCIVCLRPTRSKSLYTQIIGRGTRLYEGKEELLLLDFLWLTEKMGLCHPSALVSKDDAIAREMDKLFATGGKAVDILSMEELAEKNVAAQREEALAEMLKAMRKRQGGTVDPLQYMASSGYLSLFEEESVFKWEEKKPTRKQIAFLNQMGISTENVTTKGQASKIIGTLMDRRKKGLSTPKQIKLLERYGFEKVGLWSFKKAGEVIDAIAKNNWKVNPFIIQKFT